MYFLNPSNLNPFFVTLIIHTSHVFDAFDFDFQALSQIETSVQCQEPWTCDIVVIIPVLSQEQSSDFLTCAFLEVAIFCSQLWRTF